MATIPRAFQKLNRQPFSGQPPDRAVDDAFRRVQIGIGVATKVVEAQIGSAVGSIPPYATSALDVASADSAGTASTVSRGDHAHRGVRSLNRSGVVYGDMIFTGSVVTQSGNTFSFGLPVALFGTPNRLTTTGTGYTVQASDVFIAIVGGPSDTITLPAASVVRTLFIKNATATTTYTVAPAGSDTLDLPGGGNFTLFNSPVNFAGVILQSDGISQWFTMGVS